MEIKSQIESRKFRNGQRCLFSLSGRRLYYFYLILFNLFFLYLFHFLLFILPKKKKVLIFLVGFFFFTTFAANLNVIQIMKRNKNGDVVLTDSEFYSLIHAFGNFRDILVKSSDDSDDTYFTNENLSCLDESHYKTCCRLYEFYFTR